MFTAILNVIHFHAQGVGGEEMSQQDVEPRS